MRQVSGNKPKPLKGRKNRAFARPVSELVGKVLEPVIARRTGMTMDLIAAWHSLLSEPLGNCSRPEKIQWPRRVSDEDPFKPATLVVACEGPQAVFLQHETGIIIEKVNTFFGFTAIDRIKIVQKPVRLHDNSDKQARAQKLDNGEAHRLEAILEEVDDDILREKLRRLGSGMILKQRRSDEN